MRPLRVKLKGFEPFLFTSDASQSNWTSAAWMYANVCCPGLHSGALKGYLVWPHPDCSPEEEEEEDDSWIFPPHTQSHTHFPESEGTSGKHPRNRKYHNCISRSRLTAGCSKPLEIIAFRSDKYTPKRGREPIGERDFAIGFRYHWIYLIAHTSELRRRRSSGVHVCVRLNANSYSDFSKYLRDWGVGWSLYRNKKKKSQFI